MPLHGGLGPMVKEGLLYVQGAIHVRGELLEGQRLAGAVGVLHSLAAVAHPLLCERRLLIGCGLLEGLPLDEDGVDT